MIIGTMHDTGRTAKVKPENGEWSMNKSEDGVQLYERDFESITTIAVVI